jgi:hypothetical protein
LSNTKKWCMFMIWSGKLAETNAFSDSDPHVGGFLVHFLASRLIFPYLNSVKTRVLLILYLRGPPLYQCSMSFKFIGKDDSTSLN